MKNREHVNSPPGITVAILIIGIGGVLLYFSQSFLGWVMLAIGAYGLAWNLMEPRMNKDQASTVAVVVVIIVVVTGIFLSVFPQIQVGWAQSLIITIAAALLVVALQGMFSLIRANKPRVFLKSLAILAFSIVLIALYHLYLRQVFLLNAATLFLAAVYCRQALHELLLVKVDGYTNSNALFLPDALALIALIGGLIYYQDLLFFHLFVIILVMSVFKFATEKYISEAAEHEHAKIDEPVTEQKAGTSFFVALTGTHSNSNLVMLPAFLIFEFLSLEKYVTGFDIQGDVFQASIALLGIVIGFSTLILGERLAKNTEGWKKQTYLLRGLVGITLLFFIIAGVAFVARVLQPIVIQTQSPTASQMIAGFFSNDSVRIGTIAALANEFVLFSIPAALLYFFSLSRDLMERYERA
jgi:hypothetical protein